MQFPDKNGNTISSRNWETIPGPISNQGQKWEKQLRGTMEQGGENDIDLRMILIEQIMILIGTESDSGMILIIGLPITLISFPICRSFSCRSISIFADQYQNLLINIKYLPINIKYLPINIKYLPINIKIC